MICKHCGKDKPNELMFQQTVRGVKRVTSICKLCHQQKSNNGAKSRLQPKDGFVIVVSCVVTNDDGGNEMFYVAFGNNVKKIVNTIQGYNILPVMLVDTIKSTNKQYKQFVLDAKTANFSGKWYYANGLVKSCLDILKSGSRISLKS